MTGRIAKIVFWLLCAKRLSTFRKFGIRSTGINIFLLSYTFYDVVDLFSKKDFYNGDISMNREGCGMLVISASNSLLAAFKIKVWKICQIIFRSLTVLSSVARLERIFRYTGLLYLY